MNYLLTDDEKKFYADDTYLILRGHDLGVLNDPTNTILAKVLEWRKFNKFALKLSKSFYMLVTGKLSYNEPNLFIEADAVKRMKNFFYLGLNADENMKHHSHFEVLQKKFSQLAV